MSKRMKFLVSVLVAVVLLTVGGIATVMADDGSTLTSNTTSTNGLLVRVAEKLGVTEEELSSVFKQARQEMREEAAIRALAKAVEKGRITEEEASEIKGWWEQRPEVLESGLFQHSFSVKALGDRHGWGGHRGWCGPRLPTPTD